MIQAVIFDIDDTISLTEAVSFDIENDILVSMGQSPMSRQVHLQTWEIPLTQALPIRSPGADLEILKSAYYPKILAYTKSGKIDVIPLVNYKALDQLAELNKQLFILTSRNHQRISHLLNPDHPLAQRIKNFYYRDNLQFRKPNPKVFEQLLKDTGLLPEQCVYVGDSLHDAQAAKDAGLYFIASLESGLRQRSDFDDVAVDTFIESFSEVVTAVQTLDR